MIELVPYETSHLQTFEPGVDERLLLESRGNSLDSGFDHVAISVIEDGRTLGIFGMGYMDWLPRIAALLSDELRERPFLLHRGVKRNFEKLVERYDFDEIEADAAADNTVNNRWLVKLGFEFNREHDGNNIYRWSK